MLIFVEGRKPENPEKNPQSKVRTNNKLTNYDNNSNYYYYYYFCYYYYYLSFISHTTSCNCVHVSLGHQAISYSLRCLINIIIINFIIIIIIIIIVIIIIFTTGVKGLDVKTRFLYLHV